MTVLDVLEWLSENQGPAPSIMFFLLNIILHPLGTLEMHKLCTFWVKGDRRSSRLARMAKVPAPFLEHLRSERETGQNFGLIVADSHDLHAVGVLPPRTVVQVLEETWPRNLSWIPASQQLEERPW